MRPICRANDNGEFMGGRLLAGKIEQGSVLRGNRSRDPGFGVNKPTVSANGHR
jgi:hypothetical protein